MQWLHTEADIRCVSLRCVSHISHTLIQCSDLSWLYNTKQSIVTFPQLNGILRSTFPWIAFSNDRRNFQQGAKQEKEHAPETSLTTELEIAPNATRCVNAHLSESGPIMTNRVSEGQATTFSPQSYYNLNSLPLFPCSGLPLDCWLGNVATGDP